MSVPTSVVVHPLVLLSTVDHYYRVAKDTRNRVVGVLLGENSKGRVDVTNSYAVPFEEDHSDPEIWFLDHNFHENMFSMFKKINARENVVGWYSTGPKIREPDLAITELMRKYCPNPILVIIDVTPKDIHLPTEAYLSVSDISDEPMTAGASSTSSASTSSSKKTFMHIPSEIGALEAEEVGVEHLLRDIKDTAQSTLSTNITEKFSSLKVLQARLLEINNYLDKVGSGQLPVNNQVMYHLQDILNLLPNLNIEELVRSFTVQTNDMMLVIYLSSLIRAIIALHNLIANKLTLRDAERKLDL